MKVGVTLGKFAPLHRGHQLVIETALREVDHLIVIVYNAEESEVPLPRRAAWIRALYPAVEVIESWDGPATVGYSPEITRLHDEYLTRLLHGRGVTHFFSSEPYGDHVSRALGAVDRRVDVERTRVPISGSAIRRDPYACREWIAPLVYRDLITRVVFVGAPSTGKTTIAAELAARFGTKWMPEYGREYWEQHQIERRLSLEQLVEIAEEHRRREDALCLEANRYLFVDTDATTTRMFALDYHGRSHPRLDQLAEEAMDRAGARFLCDTDIPYDDTPDRSGPVNRQRMQEWIVEDLARRCGAFVLLSGSVEERVRKVVDCLPLIRPSGTFSPLARGEGSGV